MKLPPLLWFGMAAVSLWLTGCIGYVPSVSNKPVSGKLISRREAALIVPRRTTRAEAIRILGPGYRESPRGAALAYPWEMPAGFMFFIIGFQEGGAATSNGFTTWHALFLQFDGRDVVARKEYVRLRGGRTLDEQLDKWAGVKWAAANVPASAPVIKNGAY
jgi:hypothetical protein